MPQKQVDQVAWSQQFNDVVSANVAGYGVAPTTMSDFTALNNTLQTAWLASQQVATRTRGTVAAKDEALAAMKAAARYLVSIIQGTVSVSDQMKLDAGLTVRKTHGTSINAPTVKPYVIATNIDGRDVTIELRQAMDKRSKPPGVTGATILTATSATESTDRWTFACSTTKTTITIPFPASTTGNTVYVTAFWTNAKRESGPAATPIAINLPAGGVVMTQETETPLLKAA